MRKEIQNNPGRDAQFFAKQERIGELRETLTVHHQDQLVHAAALEECPNVLTGKNPDQFQSPEMMIFNRAREVITGWSVTYYSYITNVQSPVLGYVHQNETIGNKKDVVDGQCEHQDQPVRCFGVYKQNRRRHHYPGPENGFRQTIYLAQ